MVKLLRWMGLAVVLAGCQMPAGGTGSGPDKAPRGYERFFSPAAHNFAIVRADEGASVRAGAQAERFELRHADCGGSDCGNPRYRAEIRQLPRATPARAGEDIWYGWSFRNGTIPAYDRNDALRLVFGQWTMGGEANPVLRLIQLGRNEGNWSACNPSVCTGPSKQSGDVVVQLEDMRRTLGWGKAENDGYVCRLFDMAANRGKWVDIVMNTNFAQGPDGYLRIWVNGEMKCDYTGPLTTQRSLQEGNRLEHRRGIFASYTTRWDTAHPGQIRPNMIVQYDEFRHGRNRLDVDIRTRQSRGLKPVD